MSRISDRFTEIAVYIYTSLDDAKRGESYGGSGFMVDVPFETNTELHYLYVVTNKHVVLKAKNPVIRFNRKDGGTECIATRSDQWTHHPNGDDVSVFHFDNDDWEKFQIATIGMHQFVTEHLLEAEDIGIGDDTVMVGRFITHEGKQQNAPSVRFGNIAMMPKEKIVSESGIAQESFLVEIRSLPGYSGSAVLIYSPCAMNDMSKRRYGQARVGLTSMGDHKFHMPPDAYFDAMKPKGPYLLGIDWCHLQSKADVVISEDENGRDEKHPDRWFVRQNSGMAGVIPAWKIAEVLYCEDFVKTRKKEAERIAEEVEREKRRSSGGVSLDVAEQSDVLTREGFETALRKASRKIEPSESDSEKK